MTNDPKRATMRSLLHEVDATVVACDLREFTALAAHRSPVELGALLSRYYEHVESIVVGAGGKLIKFMGDGVLAAFLATEVPDHRRKAADALREASRSQTGWSEAGAAMGLPRLAYVSAAATGRVLAGQIGTQQLRSFDILGETVNVAMKLASLAGARGVDHLMSSDVVDGPTGRIPALEVEGVELGGRHLRLYRLG